MLGGLSRWLRMMGYDTLYYSDKDDFELRIEAEEKDRILVTRDVGLIQQASKSGVKTVLIHSDNTIDQLREIVKDQSLETVPTNTRCPRCNGDLREIEKKRVEDKVPMESYKAFDLFWICTDCGTIYWNGSHWAQIQETLKKIRDSKSL